MLYRLATRLLAALVGCAALAAPGEPPPSVLLVTIDTLRADRVGCYGRASAGTPNLDRLASRGVRFDEARAHTPLTLPSHATLLTGLLPPRHGVRANGLFTLGPDIPTLPALLQARGYATAAVVASVVLDRAYGLDRGFGRYDDNQRVGERNAFDYLERGASQIANASRRELARLEPPFFLWVHLYDPHWPWVAPAAFAQRHTDPYDAEIAFADSALGEILRDATARAEGRLIVAATSDHGESLGEHGEFQHGYTLHRGVLRVPLLLAGPGVPAGRAVSTTVGLVDLAATIADLVGLDPFPGDGQSLRPLFGGDARLRSAPLWEETLHPLYDSGWAPLRGLLTASWHVVDAPRPELYDRRSDPDDARDVAALHPEILARMRGRLAAVAADLGDRLEPEADETDTAEQRERLERLASLGYLSSGARRAPDGPRLDPKDGLPGFAAIERADALLDVGDAAGAVAAVEPHTRTDPNNPRLWHQLGRALLLLPDLDRAHAALRRAIELAPEHEFIRLTHAQVLRARGDLDAATAELERIVAANPRAVDATLELAAIAVGRDEIAHSEKLLQGAYRAGVRDPDLLDRLGHHAARRGDDRAAETHFREALALRPGDPGAHLGLGQARLRGGDARGAITWLEGCVNGERGLECRIELARALVIGPRDLSRAREVLLGALELGPEPALRAEVERRLEALAAMRP